MGARIGFWCAAGIAGALVLSGCSTAPSIGSNPGAAMAPMTLADSTAANASPSSTTADAAAADTAPTGGSYEKAVAAATDPLSPARLILVARYGHEREVKYLLQNHVDVNARDKFGGTALIAAAEGGHENIVKILIDGKADINVRTQDGVSALMAASSKGNVAIVNSLLAAGADRNAVDNIGESALFYAVRLGHIDVARALLNAGADPNIQNRNKVSATNSGYTPLMYAAERGYNPKADWEGMTHLLLAKGARPNVRSAHGNTPLSIAESRADRSLIDILEKAGAREERIYFSLSDETALIKAARIGDMDKLQSLLDLGIKPEIQDDKGVTPLLAATYEGHLPAIKALVKAGAKLDRVPVGLREWAFSAARAPLSDHDLLEAASRGDTALIVAIRRGHDAAVKYLLEVGADPKVINSRGDAPIFVAATGGQVVALRALLARGVDPNTLETEKLTVSMSHQLQSMGRNTPIIAAAQGGHADVVTELIKAGADVNYAGFLNKTALLWASERGYTTIVETLLSKKANPNVNDIEGLTPLIVAARGGNSKIVKALLNAGADPNKAENSDYPGQGGKAFGGRGMTPLIYAARAGHDEIVRMLISARADVNAMTQDGESAMKEARNNGNTAIVDLLSVAGAQ